MQAVQAVQAVRAVRTVRTVRTVRAVRAVQAVQAVRTVQAEQLAWAEVAWAEVAWADYPQAARAEDMERRGKWPERLVAARPGRGVQDPEDQKERSSWGMLDYRFLQ